MRRARGLLVAVVFVLRAPPVVPAGGARGAALEQVTTEAEEAGQLLKEGEIEEGAHAIVHIAVGDNPNTSLEWTASEVGARFDHASTLLETWWARVPKKAQKKHSKALRARATTGIAVPVSAERHQQWAVAVVGSALLAFMERRLAAPFDPELDLELCTAGARLARAAQEGWTEDTLAATPLIGSALLFCPAETSTATAVLRHGLRLAGDGDGDKTARSSEKLTLHCALIDSLDSMAAASPDAAAAATAAAETAATAYPTDVEIRRLQVATAVGRSNASGLSGNLTSAAAVLHAALARFPRDPIRQDSEGPCLSSTCHPQHDIAVSYAARRWKAAPLTSSNQQSMENGRERRRGGWGWRDPMPPFDEVAPLPSRPPPRCTIARVHHSELSPAQFRAEYASRNLPVMIVGAADPAAVAERGRAGRDNTGLASTWAAWTKEALIESHGDEVLLIRPSSGIVAAALSVDPWKPGASVNVTLREFIASWSATPTVETTKQDKMQKDNARKELHRMRGDSSDPPYHFKNPSPTSIGEEWMPADAQLLWFHQHASDGSQVFSHGDQLRKERALWFLGPPGSGPFFHVHPAAYNALIYGERRWFLYPPHGLQHPPSVPMPQWVAAYDARLAAVANTTVGSAKCPASSAETDGLCGAAIDLESPKLKRVVWDLGWESISECKQEGGDVLFIPSGWHHAVLNTQESVGMAIELGDNVQLVDAVLGVM